MENSKDIVYLNGKDVTSRIREKDVAKIVSFCIFDKKKLDSN